MGTLIDGKEIAKKLNNITADKVQELKAEGTVPKLAVVLVGDHKPSETYVRKKQETAEMLGVAFELHRFTHDISESSLLEAVEEIQKDPNLSGLIIQLPLPEAINDQTILNAVHPDKDVDCLRDDYMQILERSDQKLVPPTPGAILEILNDLDVDLAGKKVAVLGRGKLVGKPIAILLRQKGAEVTVCHSKSTNTEEVCKAADIIVTGVGKKNLVRGTMIKEGAIVIDAGTAADDGVSGDVNVEEVKQIASFVTPTPGGVGPLTVACLLKNTVHNAS